MGNLNLVWSTDGCFMSTHIREINKEFHNESLTKDLACSTRILKVTTCVCIFFFFFERCNSGLNTMTESVHRGVPVISGWGSSCFCDRNEELAPPLLSPHLHDHLQLCGGTFIITFSEVQKWVNTSIKPQQLKSMMRCVIMCDTGDSGGEEGVLSCSALSTYQITIIKIHKHPVSKFTKQIKA